MRREIADRIVKYRGDNPEGVFQDLGRLFLDEVRAEAFFLPYLSEALKKANIIKYREDDPERRTSTRTPDDALDERIENLKLKIEAVEKKHEVQTLYYELGELYYRKALLLYNYGVTKEKVDEYFRKSIETFKIVEGYRGDALVRAQHRIVEVALTAGFQKKQYKEGTLVNTSLGRGKVTDVFKEKIRGKREVIKLNIQLLDDPDHRVLHHVTAREAGIIELEDEIWKIHNIPALVREVAPGAHELEAVEVAEVRRWFYREMLGAITAKIQLVRGTGSDESGGQDRAMLAPQNTETVTPVDTVETNPADQAKQLLDTIEQLQQDVDQFHNRDSISSHRDSGIIYQPFGSVTDEERKVADGLFHLMQSLLDIERFQLRIRINGQLATLEQRIQFVRTILKRVDEDVLPVMRQLKMKSSSVYKKADEWLFLPTLKFYYPIETRAPILIQRQEALAKYSVEGSALALAALGIHTRDVSPNNQDSQEVFNLLKKVASSKRLYRRHAFALWSGLLVNIPHEKFKERFDAWIVQSPELKRALQYVLKRYPRIRFPMPSLKVYHSGSMEHSLVSALINRKFSPYIWNFILRLGVSQRRRLPMDFHTVDAKTIQTLRKNFAYAKEKVRDHALLTNPGGIDLVPTKSRLNAQGTDFKFNPHSSLPMPSGPIEGFYPVIINIVPTTNLPFLLGINLNHPSQQKDNQDASPIKPLPYAHREEELSFQLHVHSLFYK